MIEFSKSEKELLVDKLKDYFDAELKQEIGGFDAEFLLDFISREIGSYFYNRGLYDAQNELQSKLDGLSECIYQLEQPTDFSR
ncbi:DUF2164 domain-containing protein [Ketobacter sp. MCCC 1A13808]|uniref:DUF2164 domain-containing protein n=1 Tax=Ketobacter sp. MCCC 1A13808 TaxID=2602738 RepID=UPI000F191EAB|nr:DUF2164 domain-containing protein [Ketobacter sp. MCCC 1A13808]MVF14079.1 DUF2164 domain-containing protein [Ketobacter sp. MCCC 1A13808]RLP55105.1 MAG: DUF2164 domain-containing protein [Ketobacter sp.]